MVELLTFILNYVKQFNHAVDRAINGYPFVYNRESRTPKFVSYY